LERQRRSLDPRDPAREPNVAAASAGALVPTLQSMAVPLSLAGFAPREAEKLASALKPFNIVAMAGGGGGGGMGSARVSVDKGRLCCGGTPGRIASASSLFQPGS